MASFNNVDNSCLTWQRTAHCPHWMKNSFFFFSLRHLFCQAARAGHEWFIERKMSPHVRTCLICLSGPAAFPSVNHREPWTPHEALQNLGATSPLKTFHRCLNSQCRIYTLHRYGRTALIDAVLVDAHLNWNLTAGNLHPWWVFTNTTSAKGLATGHISSVMLRHPPKLKLWPHDKLLVPVSTNAD